jgi:hypothetical protein
VIPAIIETLNPSRHDGEQAALEQIRIVPRHVEGERVDYDVVLDWGWADTTVCTCPYEGWANGVARAIGEVCGCSDVRELDL